jgi:hypothetical protein
VIGVDNVTVLPLGVSVRAGYGTADTPLLIMSEKLPEPLFSA